MIPNGVLLIEKYTHSISFANNEIKNIVGETDSIKRTDLKEKVSDFLVYNQQVLSSTSIAEVPVLVHSQINVSLPDAFQNI